MIWIRTIKNNYNLDVVIDSTDNEQFVITSGLEWSLLTDEKIFPENGSYYYDGKIISIDSNEYDEIISPLINAIEEPLKVERETIEKENEMLILEEIEKQKLLMEEQQSLMESEPPSPIDYEKINSLSSYGMVDPRSFPATDPEPITGVESTEENFQIWYERYLNLLSLLDALKSNQYVEVINNVIVFDPPHTFPDGIEQKYFPFPEENIEGYINYLIAVKVTYNDLFDVMCNDLGLPLVER